MPIIKEKNPNHLNQTLVELYGRAEIFEYCIIDQKLHSKLRKSNGKLSLDEELDIWDELPGDLYIHGIFDSTIKIGGEIIDNEKIAYLKNSNAVNPFIAGQNYWVRIIDAKLRIAYTEISGFNIDKLNIYDQRIRLPNGQIFEGHFINYPDVEFYVDRDDIRIKSENSYLYDKDGNEIEFLNSDSQ